jgi:hypothetical protein
MRSEEVIRVEINSLKHALPLPVPGNVLRRVSMEARIRALEWVVNGIRASAAHPSDQAKAA